MGRNHLPGKKYTKNGRLRAFLVIQDGATRPQITVYIFIEVFITFATVPCRFFCLCDHPGEPRQRSYPFVQYLAKYLAHSVCSIIIWSVTTNDLWHFYFLLTITIEHNRRLIKSVSSIHASFFDFSFCWRKNSLNLSHNYQTNQEISSKFKFPLLFVLADRAWKQSIFW